MSQCAGTALPSPGRLLKRVAITGILAAALLFTRGQATAQNEPPAGPPAPAKHVHPPGDTAPHEHPAPEIPPPHVPEPAEAAPHEHEASREAAPGHIHPETTSAAAVPEGEHAPHEHPATMSVPDTSFVRTLLLVTLGFAGLLLVFARLQPGTAKAAHGPAGKDLLEVPVLGRFLRWRHFPTLLILPTLAVFVFIVLAGLFGEQSSGNPAVLLTWILWWPAVIFTFFLVGRIWCTACPFGYLGDVAQKLFSLQRKVPRILKNMWWRLGLFLGLTWATTLWAWDRWPRSTAWMALALTLGAIALAFVYEKRTFCRYVCPVGGVFGLYSMTAPLRLAAKDKQICQNECKEKNCYQACAWFQFPASMDRNAECNLCLTCVSACPYNNLALRSQPFGADLAQFHPHRKSLDEASTVAAVLGVSMLQTLVMLESWPGWEATVGSWLGVSAGPVLYTLIFVSLGLLVPLVFLGVVSRLALGDSARRAGAFSALRRLAYGVLPLGLGLHAAHNFHHLFGEGNALWEGVKGAFIQSSVPSLGWVVSADNGRTIPAASATDPNALFFLQWLALLGGLVLAFRIATYLAQRHAAEKAKAFRLALPVFLFAVGYTILSILILAAPMAHRH